MENFAWFNGQKVAFTDGQTILQVAKQADILSRHFVRSCL